MADFNDDPRCPWCSKIVRVVSLILGGSEQPGYICDNSGCSRYGCVSIYKLVGTGVNESPAA